MTIYRITTANGVMYASANLVQASARIDAYFGDEPDYKGAEDHDGYSWQLTPYQTADACHSQRQMAKLVADYWDMGRVRGVKVLR